MSMGIWKNSISRERIETVANNEGKQRIRTMDYFSDAWNMVQQDLGLHIGFSLITSLLIYFLSIFGNPLLSGWFIAAHMKRKNQPIELGTFFKSFEHYGGLIIYNLLMFLILFIPFVILLFPGAIMTDMMVSDEDVSGLMFMLYFGILVFIISLLSMFFIFAPLLIVFSNMDAWTAMKASSKVVKKNMGGFFGFFMMTVVMHILGMMTCCLSYIVVLPVIQIATYFAYEDIFKPEVESDLDDIIRHLV